MVGIEFMKRYLWRFHKLRDHYARWGSCRIKVLSWRHWFNETAWVDSQVCVCVCCLCVRVYVVCVCAICVCVWGVGGGGGRGGIKSFKKTSHYCLLLQCKVIQPIYQGVNVCVDVHCRAHTHTCKLLTCMYTTQCLYSPRVRCPSP